ncbi:MAG: hypothetical protein Q8J89_02000 [Caulobacter sp.]|nr:hypothetical protein [Caulobacter sp.]
MAILAFTPLVWILGGRPDESYPELVFFGIGLPSALVALVAMLVAGRGLVRPSLTRNLVLASACVLGLAVCGVLVAMVAVPEGFASWLPEQTLLALSLVWLPLLVAVLCAAYLPLTWTKRNRD